MPDRKLVPVPYQTLVRIFEKLEVASLRGLGVSLAHRLIGRMSHPSAGDMVIRDSAAGFVIADAVTHAPMSGPFPTIAEAAIAAWRLAAHGHVWRENLDARGRALGPPFLLELRASALA